MILDFGTSSVRAGYSGEDAPRITFPTQFCSYESEMKEENGNPEKSRFYGENFLFKPKKNAEIDSAYEFGKCISC